MPPKTILSLDIGNQRIGVALASIAAKLPAPFKTIKFETAENEIGQIIQQQNVVAVVVGLPRGLNGQETDQTRRTRKLAKDLQSKLEIPLYLQDEALSSKRAESELSAHGKPYDKANIDSLAACYILEDWLVENGRLFR